MGLSIHYSGRIKNPDLLLELIDEIKEIAETFDWEYAIYNRDLPAKIDEKMKNPDISLILPEFENPML